MAVISVDGGGELRWAFDLPDGIAWEDHLSHGNGGCGASDEPQVIC